MLHFMLRGVGMTPLRGLPTLKIRLLLTLTLSLCIFKRFLFLVNSPIYHIPKIIASIEDIDTPENVFYMFVLMYELYIS